MRGSALARWCDASERIARARSALRRALFPLFDLFRELRHDVEQITDDAAVDELEDRRLGVLVDGDDRLRCLHAGPVLDRAGDADRHVELWRDGLACLPDLVG